MDTVDSKTDQEQWLNFQALAVVKISLQSCQSQRMLPLNFRPCEVVLQTQHWQDLNVG